MRLQWMNEFSDIAMVDQDKDAVNVFRKGQKTNSNSIELDRVEPSEDSLSKGG